MTTTIEGVYARGYLAGWLQGLTAMTSADINAIPDDKWTESFGGCSKSANMLMADTITNLRWTTAVLQGKESSAYNDMGSLAAQLADKGAAISALNEATGEFASALAAADDGILNSTVMAPWQMPTPVFMLAQIAVSHVWYHDGQLNYIQTLLGDDKIHWMGG